jgi:hypothetical protein
MKISNLVSCSVLRLRAGVQIEQYLGGGLTFLITRDGDSMQKEDINVYGHIEK